MLRTPKTLDEFLRIPTLYEWDAEIRRGWPGPNGSSFSSDSIAGTQIGVTSPLYQYAFLPANLHDYFYQISRRMGGLPEAWRKSADQVYINMCRHMIVNQAGDLGWFRRLSVNADLTIRYLALRHLGHGAWYADQ